MSGLIPAEDDPEDTGELLFYRTEDGQNRIQLRLYDGTVWLTQKQLSKLYQVSVKTVNEHLVTLYDDGELSSEATIRKFRIVQTEGNRQVSRLVDHYRLEAILSVGYRVRSQRGVQFRRWATSQLQELLVKGFVMDDQRLKEGQNLGTDYFDELLERIRDIRASEKRFYQKIRDLYKLSIDYDKDAGETQLFFQVVQNKLHFAITGKTAAEIINDRADNTQPNMGLTSWKGAKVRKTDVTVAKNYLTQAEIGELNRIVVMYLDYAEDQARRRQPLYMADWRIKLDAFLQFNEREILQNAGNVSMEVAKRLAESEYDKFHARRLTVEEKSELSDDIDELRKRLRAPQEKYGENQDESPQEDTR
jgi:hypothetical protein